MCMCPRRPRTARRCIPPLRALPGRAATSVPPSLWQKVIARCAHLRPDLESYDRNRKALYEGLTRMGYEMAKPDGAFYLFIKAPGGDANAFSDAAKKKDLLVVPGDGFWLPGIFPHLLLRESGNDSEESAGV